MLNKTTQKELFLKLSLHFNRSLGCMGNLDKCVIRWFVICQERLHKEGFHFSSQKIIQDEMACKSTQKLHKHMQLSQKIAR